MSDALKHECGIALIRLLKPLDYYKEKYGSAFYGVNKMYLMMEKQHNRGQDELNPIKMAFPLPMAQSKKMKKKCCKKYKKKGKRCGSCPGRLKL